MDHNGSRRYCNYSKEIDLQTETSNCSLRSLALKICLAEPELALLSFSPPHGGRSSTVEPRIVVPDVAGSNPVGHPSKNLLSEGESPRKYGKLREKARFRAITGDTFA